MSLGTILEAPEHEFDDEEWEDDEEFDADGEELDLDEYDDPIEEDGDEDEFEREAAGVHPCRPCRPV
jgi:hypothetical protein